MNITIFRFGHRIERDKRITTHCALVSRAFGCKNLYYSGQEDNHFENSIREVCEDFGGNLNIKFINNYEKFFEENKNKYYIIHLTMYGTDFNTFAKKIKKENLKKPLLIFVGSQKVPSEIYHLADANVCVTNQPHSEVAALGLLLNALVDYKKVKFTKAKIQVKENPKGKTIIKK